MRLTGWNSTPTTPKHGGYFEAIRRDGTPILSWKAGAPQWQRTDRLGVYYGFKSMNSHIHLLEALTELAKVDDRPIVRERLRETFLIVRDRIAVEPGALNLYLTPDWRSDPGARLLRPRRRDGLSARRGRARTEAAPMIPRHGRSPACWSIMRSNGAGTSSTAASTIRVSRLAATRST